MELQSVVAIALGAACGASGFALWRWAKNLPEGYEDSEGFHLGEQPVPEMRGRFVSPVLVDEVDAFPTPPAIDWSKPLELSDGTPVVLSPQDVWGKTNPDGDGDYWVRLPGRFDICVGRGDDHPGYTVRNRAEPPAAANSNLPALTSVQRAVLIEMSEEIGYTAAVLAANTQAPHKLVVQARRDLAKMGLAVLVSLNGDGGEATTLAGRGYILTREGARVRDELLAVAA